MAALHTILRSAAKVRYDGFTIATVVSQTVPISREGNRDAIFITVCSPADVEAMRGTGLHHPAVGDG